MPKVEYKQGIECKCCGDIIYKIPMHQRLCQECGAQIIDDVDSNYSVTLGKYGRGIVVKVTHKMFRDIYEKVRNY
jgi:hypothetical protein